MFICIYPIENNNCHANREWSTCDPVLSKQERLWNWFLYLNSPLFLFGSWGKKKKGEEPFHFRPLYVSTSVRFHIIINGVCVD